MKKILLLLLMICLVTTTWAMAGSVENRFKLAQVPDGLSVSEITLEELLMLLSEKSGVTVMAVPEVAEMKVDLKTMPNLALEQILTGLGSKYQLAYKLNNKTNAVIVFKDSYHHDMWGSPQPQMLYRTKLSQAEGKVNAGSVYTGLYSPQEGFNTEEYSRIYDNNYQDTLSSPLSTFSIDVDTASYSNVRRFINSGQLPPPDAVRTEEMLNYFKYDYRQPSEEHPFTLTTEVADCPWQPKHKLVMIGIQGKQLNTAELPSSNLVFLIDVSGSMNQPNKLPLLKTAFKMLVNQMRSQDRVAIVSYAGKAGLVLESTPGSDQAKIINAIDNLQAGGSTAGGEGIKLAYKIAQENMVDSFNNRVILATDGDFNVGVTSEGELTRLIEEQRSYGIFLSVLGFGMGNIKDNKMEALADQGNGTYAYIDNALEAKKVMVSQFAGTLYTIAKDVKLQVEFNPAKVKSYRLIGYENRKLDNRDFNNDNKDAGDMGAGHSVTAFFEVIPVDEAVDNTDGLIFQRSAIVPSDDLLQVKIRYKKPAEDNSILFDKRISIGEAADNPSDNFRLAAAIAEYAMLLRNSEFKGESSYQQVLNLVRNAKGHDSDGYRAEFIRMVEISQLLTNE